MGRAGQARAEGMSAERRIGGEKRAGLQEQGRRGHPCSSAHSQVTNIHRMFLPMQDSWNPNWGKFQFSEDSHSSIWFRLPLYEKRAHRERQFGVSQWKNLPNAFSGQGLPGLSMFMMSSVDSHRLSEPDCLWDGKHPSSVIKTAGDGKWRVSEDLTETVALNNGLSRVSPVDILGKSLPSRLASKCKGPEEIACSKNPKEANFTERK